MSARQSASQLNLRSTEAKLDALARIFRAQERSRFRSVSPCHPKTDCSVPKYTRLEVRNCLFPNARLSSHAERPTSLRPAADKFALRRPWLISTQRRNVTRELLFFMFSNNVEDPLWKIESKVT